MADFRFTPDPCLLAIARVAFNHFEPDDRLAIFQEVIRRWAEIVEKDKEHAKPLRANPAD